MNVVYDYPKTSCDCDFKYNPKKISPNNLGVKNCETPNIVNNNEIFMNNIEPSNKEGFHLINPDVMTSKYACDFFKSNINNDKCPHPQYTSNDPRLVSVTQNQILTFSRPTLDSSIKLEKISTDTSLDNYGQKYTSYSDIKSGDIMYYIDESIKHPFFKPNFITPSTVDGKVYQDPMGSVKPQYHRSPICNKPLRDDNFIYNNLSWIQDSQEFRENIMASQMEKRNQQRWESRWN
jgi:hypothetical protein